MASPITIDAIKAHVTAVLTPLAQAKGLEIVELEIGGHAKDVQIQVFADLNLNANNAKL